MFTQQSGALASALALPPGQQQTQALLQVFANCVQGLRTNGPVNINTGAGRNPPRGGVISFPPGNGTPLTPPPSTGDPLNDYLNGRGDSGGGYPPGTWNINVINNDNSQTNYGGPTSITFGGDTQYGDNYQITNNANDYNTYNNYNVNNNNSQHSNNVNNWYQNQYTDNSYNDFSTTLNTTQNQYTQNVNNFEGDTYFQNIVNQGNVTNQSTVVNEGSVFNAGDTYFNESRTFVTNQNTTINLATYITNLTIQTITNIFQGGGGGDVPQIPTGGTFKGNPQTLEITVKEYTFNAQECKLDETERKLEATFTPSGTVSIP